MKTIWVTFQRKGLHKYPGAPEDVSYLSLTHRHLFKFKVTIEVTHSNRDIEFHQFLNWLESLYEDSVLDLAFKSCEMLADDLAVCIQDKFGKDRTLSIEISEDGECGVTCTY